jgi:DNA polymerase-4
MQAYASASKAVFEIFRDTTPIVEGISIDEAFLDVTGLRRVAGPPAGIAARLRREVRDQVDLPITVGVARTKFLAKVASRVAKPDGLLVVEPVAEVDFLHPLPVGHMWGVGPATTAVLDRRGIHTVADMAAVGESVLVGLLGPHAGRHLFALAMGRDPRPVRIGQRRRSVGAQRALGRRKLSVEEQEGRLVELVDGLARRLRKAERTGSTVTLRLRFGDYTKATRSSTLTHPTDRTDVLAEIAVGLLARARTTIDERGLTLIGAAVSGLAENRPVQLLLPFGGQDHAALDAALDQVKATFGRDAIGRASRVGHRAHRPAPMLPD